MDSLVVALVGLGGLYAISQDKKKEGFNQSTIPHDETRNILLPEKTIPIEDDDYVNKTNAEQTTDQYYKNIEQHSELIGATSIQSLTGNNTPSSDFKHNNMVPFFGSSVKGIAIDSNSSQLLDNLGGNGSQFKSKEESAPLFKPEENVQWSHGMPNHNDYFQKHQTTSNIRNNTKPWSEVHVAPGLGKGYSSQGQGGFNAGMQDRKEWMPKTVDQLRTVSNPKVTGTLGGLEGPAQSKILNRGLFGKMEKNRPDTDYVLGSERFFTTNGIEIAPTAHSKQMMPDVNRPDTSCPYFGATGTDDFKAQSAPQIYNELAKKEHCYTGLVGNAYANGENSASANDYSQDSYKLLANNRNTTNSATEFGIVGSIIGSVVAPVLDILRPSRKENVLGNLRESGNVQHQGGTYTMNPGDKPKTTIKEMTTGKGNHINVQGQSIGTGTYKVDRYQPIVNQRDTTNRSKWGNAVSDTPGPMQIDKYNRQRNNVNKGQTEYTPSGYENLFSGNITADICTKRGDCQERVAAPSLPIQPIGVDTYGKLNGLERTSQIDNERIDKNLLDAFKQNPYTHSITSYA
tara:strand:- start:1878 stop:3593 length:1716 start_codon:yes stop_codon:yes gene_type:complete